MVNIKFDADITDFDGARYYTMRTVRQWRTKHKTTNENIRHGDLDEVVKLVSIDEYEPKTGKKEDIRYRFLCN